jgi:hypothetical protein
MDGTIFLQLQAPSAHFGSRYGLRVWNGGGWFSGDETARKEVGRIHRTPVHDTSKPKEH